MFSSVKILLMTPYLLNLYADDINGVIHVGAHLGQEVEDYIKYNLKKLYCLSSNKIFSINF